MFNLYTSWRVVLPQEMLRVHVYSLVLFTHCHWESFNFIQLTLYEWYSIVSELGPAEGEVSESGHGEEEGNAQVSHMTVRSPSDQGRLAGDLEVGVCGGGGG